MASFDVPVAYIFFNRPDHTARSFEAIRRVRPSRLFLIRDAARTGYPEDRQRVAASSKIAERIDWPCEVKRFFAEENMGCGRRISSGINAAMRHSDRLIVLEDDCVPNPSFFDYCRVMLDRYEHDDSVMSVGGSNFLRGSISEEVASKSDYYFSKYAHIWGWATWRSAWQHYDYSMKVWPAFGMDGGLADLCRNQHELEYWRSMFDKVAAGRIDTWDFQWMLACWRRGGRCIVPRVNLVQNIGFDDRGTRTGRKLNRFSIPAAELTVRTHPSSSAINTEADVSTDNFYYSGTLSRPTVLKRLSRRLRGLHPYGQPRLRPCG